MSAMYHFIRRVGWRLDGIKGRDYNYVFRYRALCGVHFVFFLQLRFHNRKNPPLLKGMLAGGGLVGENVHYFESFPDLSGHQVVKTQGRKPGKGEGEKGGKRST